MRSIRSSLLLLAALAGGCGNDAPPAVRDTEGDSSEHVHGLGFNPGDGAVFMATHSGLWRWEPGTRRMAPVGRLRRDIMGFTVLGPDRFLASGHPAPGERGPPFLGLVESRDAGATWTPKSLYGRADLHIIRPAGRRLYAVDSANGALLSTTDDGRSWRVRPPPGSLLDLAVHPREPDHLLAVTDSGLQRSTDAGRTWRPLGDRVGVLAWTAPHELYLVDRNGTVAISADGGRSFERLGAIEGAPVAIAYDAERLFVVVEDATIWESRDDGRSWRRRVPP